MSRLTILLVVVVMATFSSPLRSQERKLEPVEEAMRDLSWAKFKNLLLDAVMRHDRKFVLSILDRNVRIGVDGARGVNEFSKQWHLDAKDSPLWRDLPSTLFLGAAYRKSEHGVSELCAPYLYAQWPRGLDPHAYGAIISKDALVKAAPSSNSPTLATLSYDIVPVADWEVADSAPGFPQKWTKVKLKTGEGYVPEEQIRSPIEQVACFVKTGNGWRMTAFAPAGG
jgi:hypothetical protein